MVLSCQTVKGILGTVNSVVEATKILLQDGVKEVFTNRFCQDPLESHFGRHRGLSKRCDNPTLYTFGYQENKLRIQSEVALSLSKRGKGKKSVSRLPLKRRKKMK